MDDLERMIGRLEEHSVWAKDNLGDISRKIDTLSVKVDHLAASHSALKWKITGGMTVISFVVALAMELIRK